MLKDRIKAARKYRGRNQKWLAFEMGITQASVSDWEVGKSSPTVENLEKISVLFEVSFEWLATGRGEMLLTVPLPPTNEVEALVRAMQGISPTQREIVLRFVNDWMKTVQR